MECRFKEGYKDKEGRVASPPQHTDATQKQTSWNKSEIYILPEIRTDRFGESFIPSVYKHWILITKKIIDQWTVSVISCSLMQ